MKNKLIIVVAAVLIIIIGGIYFYSSEKGGGKFSGIEKLKADYPELTVYVDDVIKGEQAMEENPEEIENYAFLGLAWKSLADWSGKYNVENSKNYYREALEVYERGIGLSERRNTLLMVNAGNMAQYLENYELAEDYYKEAISVAPGDVSLYVSLAELYEQKMNKTQEEIIAVYDEGINIAVDSGFLVKRKESYLKRLGQ